MLTCILKRHSVCVSFSDHSTADGKNQAVFHQTQRCLQEKFRIEDNFWVYSDKSWNAFQKRWQQIEAQAYMVLSLSLACCSILNIWELFDHILVSGMNVVDAWKKLTILSPSWTSFLQWSITPSANPHTVNVIFVTDRAPWNMKQPAVAPRREHPLHQMLHLFPQKADRFPTEQRIKWRRRSSMSFPSPRCSLFELQRQLWASLSSPMSFRPAAFCLLHNPNKVF